MLDTLTYKDIYVTQTSHYHPEISGVPVGDAGEPFTYSIVSDGFISITLCLCFVMSIIMAARSWRFTTFQLSNLLRTPRENSAQMRETSNEVQYQGWFILQAILMMGLLAFSATVSHIDDSMLLESQCKIFSGQTLLTPYYVLGILCGIFAIYYLVKEILYNITNMVYFGRGQRHMFNVSRLFLMALYGAALLPITMTHLYLDLEPKTTLTIVLSVLSVCLLLRFYRVWSIFFRKSGNLLKFFLYLCTLEIVPLALLVGVLLLAADILKINI